MGFNLRSGNRSSFKSMGSSPMKNEEKTIPAQADANEKFEEKEFLENQERLVPAQPTREEAEHMMKMDQPNWHRVRRDLETNDTIGEDNPNFIGPQNKEEDFRKGEDYIVDDGQDKIGRDENGRMIPVDDGEYKPTLNRNKLDYLESEVNNYLGNPMDKAYEKSSEIVTNKAWDNTPIPLIPDFDDRENPDPLRHTLAAMYTSEKVGMIPTNVMGVMHELTAKNTPKEHREDILNNFIGSIIGSVPFTSTERKEQIVQKMWEKGLLFSGTHEGSYEHEFLEKHKKEREEEEKRMDVNEVIEEAKKEDLL